MPGSFTWLPPSYGEARIILPAAPGAGNQLVQTIPAGEGWILQSFKGQFTTAVAAANRNVRIMYFDPAGNQTINAVAGLVQVASQTVIYHFAVGLNGVTDNALAGAFKRTEALWADAFCVANGFITTGVSNMQGADAWTSIELVYTRFRM